MDKGIYMMCKIKLPIAADSHEANSGNVEPNYPWQLVCIYHRPAWKVLGHNSSLKGIFPNFKSDTTYSQDLCSLLVLVISQ